MTKQNIIVLEGGYNEEHEVSLSTAKEVKNAILELNYNLESIKVNPKNFYKKIKKFNADICFNALHGPFGEDGKVQQILFDNISKMTQQSRNYRCSKVMFQMFHTFVNVQYFLFLLPL